MSWIKDNKFLVGLGAGTLAGLILLLMLGLSGSKKYSQAKEEFDSAAADAMGYESSPLYPRDENRDGKAKAIDEYRTQVESLQESFAPFRTGELKNVTPQAFTDHLKAVNEEVVAAFEKSGTKLPEDFFLGFENYTTSLARGESTGILDYQLNGVRKLLLDLAASGATELNNLYRPALPEEEGKEYQPKPDDATRPLSLEIVFTGPEPAARKFVSSVMAIDERFVVIRNVRVTNSNSNPPSSADAKFEKPASEEAAEEGGGDIFGGAFVLPGEETEEAAPEEAAADAAPDAAVEDEPEAEDDEPSDSSRILHQVLGAEEVHVFLSLDLMQFLPAKELP